MDKLKFLKGFENTRAFRLLSYEELRLYIFLLMCADGIDIKGTVDLKFLRKIMRKEITLDNLKMMASNLEKFGLAEIFLSEDGKGLQFIIHGIKDG